VTRRPPSPPTARRDGLGAAGEDAAAAHLRRLGFRVVARNLRTADAEIDLLVRRRRLWIAVEVKTRWRGAAPERAVGADQHGRLRRALLRLAPLLRPRPRELRVDVVAVVAGEEVGGAAGFEVRHFAGRPFEPAESKDR
jgi:putative endonuclease